MIVLYYMIRDRGSSVEHSGRLGDPDAGREDSKFILENLRVAMSPSLAPVPADNLVLPVPTLRSEHSQVVRRSTDSSWSQRSRTGPDKMPAPEQNSLTGVWRHTIGIILLLATVILWTASNFLASVGVTVGR